MEYQQASSLFEKLQEPSAFFFFCTGNIPTTYQSNILTDFSSNVIVKAGRQVGKTEVVAVKALYFALTHKNWVVIIVAPTQRQSSIAFDRIADFIDSNPLLKMMIKRKTLTMCEFWNNSKIISLPSGPDGAGIRGYPANVIFLTEAAFMKDRVYTAVRASRAAQTKKKNSAFLIMESSPCGKRGFFYECYYKTEIKNEVKVPVFSTYEIQSSDAPFIDSAFLAEEKETMTIMEYQQEYEGIFVEEVGVLISRELYIDAQEDYEMEEIRSDRDYFLGVDVARYGTDDTVFVIVSVDRENNTRIEKIEATSKMPTTDTAGRIINLHNTWNFKMTFVDETGLGGGPVDMLEENHVPVNPIYFTLKDKMEMYSHLKWLFERKSKYEKMKQQLPDAEKFKRYTITVPADAGLPEFRKLMNQTTGLLTEFTSTGLMKIHSPDKGHDDYPDALALACLSTFKADKDKIIDLEE